MKSEIKTELFIDFIKQNNLTKTEFCKMCKISPSTFKKIMDNESNFNMIALFKIARVIKIEVYQMFN